MMGACKQQFKNQPPNGKKSVWKVNLWGLVISWSRIRL